MITTTILTSLISFRNEVGRKKRSPVVIKKQCLNNKSKNCLSLMHAIFAYVAAASARNVVANFGAANFRISLIAVEDGRSSR